MKNFLNRINQFINPFNKQRMFKYINSIDEMCFLLTDIRKFLICNHKIEFKNAHPKHKN